MLPKNLDARWGLSSPSVTALCLPTLPHPAHPFPQAWHHWAYFNCEAMVYYGKADATAAQQFVAPAVTGFFRSIELGQAQGEGR